MQTVFALNKHGMVEQKTMLLQWVTDGDQARIADQWHHVDNLPPEIEVDAINQGGLMEFAVGETLAVRDGDKHLNNPVLVKITAIRLMYPSLLESDIPQLGYTSHDEFMADWGDTFKRRVWQLEFERLDEPSMQVSAVGYVTPEEMADMHDVDVHTIRRILWADQKKPEDQRRLPGAIKEGTKYRGEWQIPLEVAQNWNRSRRGRKSGKPD